jgi:glucose dehydrogenase
MEPGGDAVFVTGMTYDTQSSDDYGTVAYEGSTGKRLWVHRYDGTGHSNDTGRAVATSPSGSRIFVAGISIGPDLDYDFATLCYRLS